MAAPGTLADTKKRVRALLISIKGGCTPKALYEDYREVVGDVIPFKELGYPTLAEFLCAIPDVVMVGQSRDGQLVLYATPDERTEHISRMVSKQKSGNKVPTYVQPPPKRKAPPKRVPAEFPAQLKQLFHCYPKGIQLDRFNEAFARRFGHYLRFRPWGYSSMEQLLGEMEGVEITCDPQRGSTIVRQKRRDLSFTLDSPGKWRSKLLIVSAW